ncbi:glutathione S-transferase T3-like protein [Tanacetum coccineum]
MKKKKATRNRQKRVNQTEPAPRQTAWTTEEEITLAKGWHSVSENSERGNTRKKDGFWVEVLEYVESKTKQEGRRTNVKRMTQESGAGDEDYIQKAMIPYQAECGLPFKFRQEIAFPNFNQGSQGSSKRHKSSGSNSFNAKSGDAIINLNNTVNDEYDVQEIRRPEGRDKAKNKGSKASGSSTMNDDALARLMVTEMTAAEVAQREKFMELKRREVEYRGGGISSKANLYHVKVGIPEFLNGIGNGVEMYAEKLETEFGDLQNLLVARSMKLKKINIGDAAPLHTLSAMDFKYGSASITGNNAPKS